MFYLVASAATLIYYHTLSYLVNNFFNFFKAVCCYVIDCLCVTSCSLSQLDYSTTWKYICQHYFQLFYFTRLTTRFTGSQLTFSLILHSYI